MMVMPSGKRSSEPVPALDGERQRAEQRGERRHHDRAEPQQARLDDRLARRHAVAALGVEREVDHHDGVLLHDAHQQDDADQRHDGQVLAEPHQRQQRADAGRRQRGEDRQRMDEALVEHAEHDVDRDRRGEDQPRLAGERVCELGGVAGIAAAHRRRHADLALRGGDRGDGVAERGARREVEAERRRRELLLVHDGERRGGALAASRRCSAARGWSMPSAGSAGSTVALRQGAAAW